MIQRITERGKENYGVSLRPVINGKVVQDNAFQWCLALQRIGDFDIQNRDWQAVGPVFATRKAGSKWLGFETEGPHDPDMGKHREECIAEYNALYSDEPQGSHALVSGFEHKSFPKMGRPSQGRSYRLQATITPELAAWLETQKSGDSLSDVVYRLLDGLRQVDTQQSS